MDKDRAQALQVTKEIVVKFVETGRVSPTNFADYFGPIYREVLKTILETAPESTTDAPSSDDAS